MYLYDKFTYSNQDTTNGVNVDFDHDGQPGGTISGFIVPQPVAGEVNAGKISTFAGEGDVWYGGDYVAVNGTRLWDGTNTTGNAKNNPNNVFNSTSSGLGTYDGIDIDTLGIDRRTASISPGQAVLNSRGYFSTDRHGYSYGCLEYGLYHYLLPQFRDNRRVYFLPHQGLNAA